jgi:hypothetical protein
MKRKRLNWNIIMSNIIEAKEQLEDIEKIIKSGNKVSEVELQIKLEHAYHHLNFTWNIRHISTTNYSNLTDEEFNEWAMHPKEIEVYKMDIKKIQTK